MGIETEIKVRVGDTGRFLERLTRLDPHPMSRRHFEDNLVLDYPDLRLASRQCLVRIRMVDGAALLTFKGAPRAAGRFKTREELESTVGDGLTLLAILRQLGLGIRFRYQKYRREFEVLAAGKTRVHIALDETPIGTFAEFEGSEAGIRQVARAMGYRASQYLRDSYAALYFQFCQERKRPIRHMTFESVRPRKARNAAAKTKRKDRK